MENKLCPTQFRSARLLDCLIGSNLKNLPIPPWIGIRENALLSELPVVGIYHQLPSLLKVIELVVDEG